MKGRKATFGSLKLSRKSRRKIPKRPRGVTESSPWPASPKEDTILIDEPSQQDAFVRKASLVGERLISYAISVTPNENRVTRPKGLFDLEEELRQRVLETGRTKNAIVTVKENGSSR